MKLVVDASIAIKWFVPENDSDRAVRVLEGHALSAPEFLLVECSNIVWKKARLGQLERVDGERLLDALAAGPIELIDTYFLLPAARRLAFDLDHPVYDCLYVAAAQEVGARLLTADRRFADTLTARGSSALALRLDEL